MAITNLAITSDDKYIILALLIPKSKFGIAQRKIWCKGVRVLEC